MTERTPRQSRMRRPSPAPKIADTTSVQQNTTTRLSPELAPAAPVPSPEADGAGGAQSEPAARLKIDFDDFRPTRDILVLGDWIVDDNWVVTSHRSKISTNVGHYHYRSVQSPQTVSRELCGAGRVAIFLYSAIGQSARDEPERYRISGLGIWHEDDRDILSRMFLPGNVQAHVPYVVRKPLSDHVPQDVALYNLGELLGKEERPGTTRVFRIYQQKGEKIEQLSRIDWDQAAPKEHEQHAWVRTTNHMTIAQAFTTDLAKPDPSFKSLIDLQGASGSPVSVVVKDMGKGVISQQALKLLRSQLRCLGKAEDSSWYLSTKLWSPSWFDELTYPKAHVKLLFFPEVAAHQCQDVVAWFTADGHVTREAITALKQVAAPFIGPNNRHVTVVVVVSKLRAIAMEVESDSANKLRSTLHVHAGSDIKTKEDIGAGKASAMFAAYVFGMLQHSGSARPSGSFVFEWALKVAQFWIGFERRWLETSQVRKWPSELHMVALANGKSETPKWQVMLAKPRKDKKDQYGQPLSQDKPAEVGERLALAAAELQPVGKIQSGIDADTELRHWTQALSARGVITVETREQGIRSFFQPWRATMELPGYICCAKTTRTILARLIAEIDSFNPRTAEKALSGLLVAKPGAGKSHFLRCLVESRHLRALEFNVTTMVRRGDLLAWFDQVVTTQAQIARREKLLVIIDEINATVENQELYSAFLAPLEDGYYVRSGHRFYIHPCIWLFAGTASEVDIREERKGSDFVSRLTMDTVDLAQTLVMASDTHRLENVYLGVTTARQLYPELLRIAWSVPEVLWTISPDLSVRDLRRFVKKNLDAARGDGAWRRDRSIYLDNPTSFGPDADLNALQRDLENRRGEVEGQSWITLTEVDIEAGGSTRSRMSSIPQMQAPVLLQD
jgi:hypothetical protein